MQTEDVVMLVDDSISRGGSVVASTAPGEKGGNISLLDLPMERDGREFPLSQPLEDTIIIVVEISFGVDIGRLCQPIVAASICASQ